MCSTVHSTQPSRYNVQVGFKQFQNSAHFREIAYVWINFDYSVITVLLLDIISVLFILFVCLIRWKMSKRLN